MRSGESTNQWTSIYFRFLQVTTLNGHWMIVNAALTLLIINLSVIYFLSSLSISTFVYERVKLLILISPFVSVFGMTVTHDTFVTAGALMLIALNIRTKKNQFIPFQKSISIFALFLVSMSYLGLLLIIGLAFSRILARQFKLSASLIGLAVSLLFLSTPLLHVTPAPMGLKYAPFLGDIKCIVQHPYAVVTSNQWSTLKILGDKKEWTASSSCVVADNAFFAIPRIPGHEVALIKLWRQLMTQNPQIGIMARIQRASVALPPPFFQSQPNMISTNYLIPVGQGTRDDLQQSSELFKTSVDDKYNINKELRFQKIPKAIILGSAFLFNQQSKFWGWGGLWFVLMLIFGPKVTGLRIKSFYAAALPLVFLILGMISWTPAAIPRYVMPLTFIGIIITTSYILGKIERVLIEEN
jgi:hypothetical protein